MTKRKSCCFASAASIILAAAGITAAFTTPSILPATKQHVHSTSSSLLSSTQAQNYLDTLSNKQPNDDANTNRNFWGTPRNEQEIIDFVSEAVFNEVSHHTAASNALNDNVAPTIDQHLQRIEVISVEPPLVIVHGFLEPKHCDDIMSAVLGPEEVESNDNGEDDAKNQLKRSTMGAEQDETKQRTSSTAWLHPEHCPKPLDAFSERVSKLCGLPTDNFENLQVVRYQPGQEFQIHTDHLDSFNSMDCGGRLATCLVYLNDSEDSVSESSNSNSSNDETFTGGETFFHEFKRAVSPRKGSALFWWNTIERPGAMDYEKDMFLNVDLKLRHAGLPVLTGEKWVCNKWMHPLPFPFGV
jgi:prolyl 4-hydroxylase